VAGRIARIAIFYVVLEVEVEVDSLEALHLVVIEDFGAVSSACIRAPSFEEAHRVLTNRLAVTRIGGSHANEKSEQKYGARNRGSQFRFHQVLLWKPRSDTTDGRIWADSRCLGNALQIDAL
jgi:hypothetical protein